MLIESLFDYLISLGGLARPSQPNPGLLPYVFMEPRDGVPTPASKGVDVVVGLFQTGGIPAKVREDELRKDIVDIWIRGKTSVLVRDLEERVIRPALIDKTDWQMAGMHIGESLQWRPLQRFSSDADGYIYITAYIFERRAT